MATLNNVIANANGCVGIGTTTLLSKFVVSNGSSENFEFTPASVSFNGGIFEYINRATGATRPDFNFYLGGGGGAYKFYTQGNNERMRVAADGNIGIGTSSPVQKLSVVGNIYLPQGNYITWNNGDCDIGGVFGYHLVFRTYTGVSMTEKLRIQSDGNVGIGTTSPAYKLDVVSGSMRVSSAAGAGEIYFGTTDSTNIYLKRDNNYDLTLAQHASSGNALYLAGAGNVYLSIDSNDNETTAAFIVQNNSIKSGTELFRVNEAGNVGIGSSSPSAKLDVVDAGNFFVTRDASGYARFTTTNGSAQLGLFRTGTSAGGFYIGGDASVFSVWDSSFSRLVNINTSGNIGINVASPLTKLDIANTQANGITMRFDTSTSYQAWIRPYWNSTTDSRVDFAINRSGGSTPDVIMSVGYGGNVGIGVTDPSARLTISGSGTGRILMGNAGFSTSGNYSGISLNGTLNTTAYNILSSPSDTSLYINRPSGASMFFRMANNDQMKLDSGGNLGIGTTSPSQVLHVVGNVKLNSVFGEASTTGVTAITHTTDSTQPSMYLWGKDHATYPGQVHIIGRSDNASADAGKIGFYDYNGSGWDLNMVINKGGNVGIGTTSPSSILHLNGTAPTILTLGSTSYPSTYLTTLGVDIGARAFLIFGNNGENQIRAGRTTTGGYLDFYTNNTVAQTTLASDGILTMRLSNTGNVGIGTTSPAYKLDVSGTARVGDVFLITTATTSDARLEIGSGRSGNGNSYLDLIGDATYTDYGLRLIRYDSGANSNSRLEHKGTGQLQLFVSEAGSLTISTNSSERVRVDSSGNVGIGTSSPAYKLDVNGSINTNTFMYVSYPYGNAYPLQISANNFLKADNYYYGMLIRSGDVNYISGKFQINGGSNKRVEISGYEETIGYLPVVIPGGNVGIGTAIPTSKLNAYGSGSNLSVFKAEGGNGTLFEVTDQLSGSLFSVNTIAGIPILEVFSNNRLVAGQYGSNALVISGSKVGIGLATPLSNKSLSISGDAQVLGSFTKASGTFLIDHPDPAKLGWKLQHSFVESPTVGDNIYRYVIDIDNTLSGSIELPSYWKFLNESPQIWISPVKHFGVAYGELNEELSIMNVYANNVGKYNVLLIGTRKDPTIKRLMPDFNVEFESE